MELTAERLREVLDYNPATGVFIRKVSTAQRTKVGEVVGWDDGQGYLKASVDCKIYKVHRLAWLYVYGVWPTRKLDHINRVRSDNRAENLREVSDVENGRNQSKRVDNTSGQVGVMYHSRFSKWTAQIGVDNKQKSLGYFFSKEEAVAARKAAEVYYWGAPRVEHPE